jgi:hypothetical protein
LKKGNVEDFQKFVKDHQGEYNRTEMINKYRENGGHIQKQRGLDIQRQMADIEIGQKRNSLLDYIKNIFNPRKRPEKKKEKVTTGNKRFIVIKDTVYRSRKSPAMDYVYKNIKKLMNTDSSTFLKVNVTVEGDNYSNGYFGIMIPFPRMQKKVGAKTFAKKLYDNLHIYYKNLAALYREKGEKVTMTDQILDRLERNESILKSVNTQEELEINFKNAGIEINDYLFMTITD